MVRQPDLKAVLADGTAAGLFAALAEDPADLTRALVLADRLKELGAKKLEYACRYLAGRGRHPKKLAKPVPVNYNNERWAPTRVSYTYSRDAYGRSTSARRLVVKKKRTPGVKDHHWTWTFHARSDSPHNLPEPIFVQEFLRARQPAWRGRRVRSFAGLPDALAWVAEVLYRVRLQTRLVKPE